VHSKITIESKNKQDKYSREKITTPKNVYPVRSNNQWRSQEFYRVWAKNLSQKVTSFLRLISHFLQIISHFLRIHLLCGS